MSFTNPELNRSRQGWQKERQVSDPTDPDYADKIEQKFLQDLLTLTDAEKTIALEGYSRKKREKLASQLAQMKRQV